MKTMGNKAGPIPLRLLRGRAASSVPAEPRGESRSVSGGLSIPPPPPGVSADMVA